MSLENSKAKDPIVDQKKKERGNGIAFIQLYFEDLTFTNKQKANAQIFHRLKGKQLEIYKLSLGQNRL